MKRLTTLFLCSILFLSGCSNQKATNGAQEQPVVIDENSETQVEDTGSPLSTSDDVDALSTDLDATVISEENFN